MAGALYLNSRNELQSAERENDELEKQVTEVQEKAKASLARYKGIADLEVYKADLDAKLHAERALLPKFKSLVEMENHRSQLSRTIEDLRSAETDLHGQVSAHKSALVRLKAEAEAVEEQLQMQSFGLYRPKYGFENSER